MPRGDANSSVRRRRDVGSASVSGCRGGTLQRWDSRGRRSFRDRLRSGGCRPRSYPVNQLHRLSRWQQPGFNVLRDPGHDLSGGRGAPQHPGTVGSGCGFLAGREPASAIPTPRVVLDRRGQHQPSVMAVGAPVRDRPAWRTRRLTLAVLAPGRISRMRGLLRHCPPSIGPHRGTSPGSRACSKEITLSWDWLGELGQIIPSVEPAPRGRRRTHPGHGLTTGVHGSFR